MMGRQFAYTINGPPSDSVDIPIRPSKSQSTAHEPKLNGKNLRGLYHDPIAAIDHRHSFSPVDHGVFDTATPVLPPTPPTLEDDTHGEPEEATPVLEAAKARSLLETPVNQMSPLTPDNTPPRERPTSRRFLGTQPSIASTRAESFKTAHEDLPSDVESVPPSPTWQPLLKRSLPYLHAHLTNSVHKPSPLASLPITNGDLTSKELAPLLPSAITMPTGNTVDKTSHADLVNGHDPTLTFDNDLAGGTLSAGGIVSEQIAVEEEQGDKKPESLEKGIHRGRTLRERLEDSQQSPRSPSLDKFASIIGWSNDVQNPPNNHKRWSGISSTSAVEALVIEKPRMQKKRHTLRHVSKNESLRSISSPLPNSNRTSVQSSSDSQHPLVHKKAKLSNHHRLSFSSEMSHSFNNNSNVAPAVEIIRVAVIPERSSSLQRSVLSSRRHSQSTTSAPNAFRMPNGSDNSQKKRAAVDTAERGRSRHYPPQVPQRGSSLSAPTSRNTSRANSIASDEVSTERKKAEKELRNTLDNMESERLSASLKSASIHTVSVPKEIHGFSADKQAHEPATGMTLTIESATPGSKEWAELRPTSALHTPFSQPSFMSASPEISEARMISLHLHNNHSVQIVEPHPLQESQAVQEVRRLNQSDLELQDADSPLRNPRQPPSPPQVHVIPASPLDEGQTATEAHTRPNPKPASMQRPPPNPREDSFAKTLIRNVSLKNARNRKTHQDLDSKLNPFWRPRPFWDNIEPTSPEKKAAQGTRDPGVINNSLGLPQQRIIITGPLGLVRKISERRRNQKALAKQPSYGSLRRIRTGRKLHRLPGFGMHLQLISLRDVQERILTARQRKEDERREKRREALRKSIGDKVIATGDSRFPSSMKAD